MFQGQKIRGVLLSCFKDQSQDLILLIFHDLYVARLETGNDSILSRKENSCHCKGTRELWGCGFAIFTFAP